MSDAEMITIKVDGMSLEVAPDSMLIEATDQAGINVPRFCYHHKLSVVANCRMCLVDVEKSGKPLPACATPVSPGMVVRTRSEKARAAQQDVMEFLLINHPLDCPICDQGGECELQDVSVGFGSSGSDYAEMKRVVQDKDIGPLIETEMTRCIHCTRCVRFGEEIAGMRELGATGRGESMEIGTYIAGTVSSELSGNVIDLCPVGALTAKPSRYKARAWEMRAHDSIAPHDAVGSNIQVHTFDGAVIRVVPRENEAINECWISDRDRFAYQGLTHHERLLKPQIKRDGQWFEVSWQQALDTVATILKESNPERVGGLVAPTATLEELYLFQKLMRGAGFNNIDHRLRQVDFSDQEYVSTAPVLGVSIAELEQQQAVLLIGANPRQDQPMLNHRLRKIALAGGQVMALNPRRVDFNYEVCQQAVDPVAMVMRMAALARTLAEQTDGVLPDEVADICQQTEPTEDDEEMARQLLAAEKSMVLMGNMAMQHPYMASMRALSSVISSLSGSICGYLQEASNTVGAALAGALPHRCQAGASVADTGMHVQDMLNANARLQTFVLLHAEVDDFSNPYQAAAAFRGAENVIQIAPYLSEQAKEYASVALPSSAFTESAGTYVNTTGQWQKFSGISKPPGDARPGWKILRVLGNYLDVPEFDYVSPEEVIAEIKLELQMVRSNNEYAIPGKIVLPETTEHMQRIGDVPMYRSDALVRRASALQEMLPEAVIKLAPVDVERLDIEDGDLIKAEQGDGSVQLPAFADDAIPEGCVWIQSGTKAANTLGDAFGTIEVSRI